MIGDKRKMTVVVEHFEAYGQCRDSRKIASLEKENAELKDKLNNLSSVAEVRLANWQKYEEENKELKERVKTLTIHDTNAVLNGLEMKVLKDSHKDRANKTQEQLTKAKKLIEKLLIVSCNSEVLIQYPNYKEVLEARVALEQFLKENNNEQART